MATTEPAEVIRAMYAQVDDGNLVGNFDVMDGRVAHDLINHASPLQGRAGLEQILTMIDADLGPVTVEHHHLVGEGDLAVHHVTLHGIHRGSSMPLLHGLAPTGRPITWRFIHIWRTEDGLLVEHWACRDDQSLLDQLS